MLVQNVECIKTTTTPANPARVTAICAAVESASPGSIMGGG